MGKKMKNILIYGIIIVFCGIALAGYLMQNRPTDAKVAEKPQTEQTAQTAASTTEATTAEVTTAADTKPAETAVPEEEKIEHNAIMLTDGNNVTGRSEKENKAHIAKIMKEAVAKPEENPVIGIGRGTDYAEVTAKAIENAGGMRDLIKEGDVVLIKPNICTVNKDAGGPQVTDYRVVQKVIDMALEYGAARVIVAEGSFYGNVFEYEKNRYVSLKGAELFNFNDCEKKDCYELKPENSQVGKAIFVPKIYMDADVVINVAKLKTHFLTTASLSIKNCIGIPSAKIYGNGGWKNRVHDMGLRNAIMDLNMIRKPDLAIIDGIVGGEGEGPEYNTPVKSEIIFAGRDLVALDTVGAYFMGLKIQYLMEINGAADLGLGINDLQKINVVGADLESIKMKFKL